MRYEWPQLKQRFDEKRILILAPHMDDEVIGCAGTIAKCVDQNKEVFVVFMTDGTRGNTAIKKDEELAKIRQKEADTVKGILGIKESFYLNLEDRGDWQYEEVIKALAAILEEVKPDAIFVPPSNDLHEDHRKANRIIKSIIERGLYKNKIYVYEVWTPLNPNRIVNITKTYEKKKMAIEACKSQLIAMDYAKMINGIASYRACFIPIPGISYAEAFLEQSCEEFIGE